MSLPPPAKTCVVLHHTPAKGGGLAPHFDLLVEPPTPFPPPHTGRLWTARLELAPKDWPQDANFILTPVAPHRREYLTYEGPISGDRGDVKRVDEGDAQVLLWTETEIELEMKLRLFAGRVRFEAGEDGAWVGRVLA